MLISCDNRAGSYFLCVGTASVSVFELTKLEYRMNFRNEVKGLNPEYNRLRKLVSDPKWPTRFIVKSPKLQPFLRKRMEMTKEWLDIIADLDCKWSIVDFKHAQVSFAFAEENDALLFRMRV